MQKVSVIVFCFVFFFNFMEDYIREGLSWRVNSIVSKRHFAPTSEESMSYCSKCHSLPGGYFVMWQSRGRGIAHTQDTRPPGA